MSRTAPTASRPPRTKRTPPVPPPGGWTLMEAAEILCPEAVALYRQGGEALEAAISQDQHRLSPRANRSPEIRRDAWLTLQLLDAVRRHSYLQATGRNPFAPLAPRTPLTADVLRDACERDNGDDAIYRRWVHIDFRDGDFSSSKDFEPVLPSRLADVRIEASGASPARPDPSAAGDADEGKPEYTRERGKAWLLWLRADHPAGEPPPTAAECWERAKACFSGTIARDPFYKLRAEVAPEWTKPGPRGPRNSARRRPATD
jgi:hypothetical protein